VRVTGVDIAENSIRAARERAQAEALPAEFDEGDAEALPYPDASFDVVASLFGAIFAPRPDLVAQELVRVCRPGGTIAMANWTKTGFIGQMFALVSKFIAPAGMPAPVLWGDESMVRERLGSAIADFRLTRVMYRFDYPFSPAGVVDVFRDYYGPTNRAFASLSAPDQETLHSDLVALWTAKNQSGDANRTTVDAEYLQVVAIRTKQ
jgi:SAM-dependent methyltransferase